MSIFNTLKNICLCIESISFVQSIAANYLITVNIKLIIKLQNEKSRHRKVWISFFKIIHLVSWIGLVTCRYLNSQLVMLLFQVHSQQHLGSGFLMSMCLCNTHEFMRLCRTLLRRKQQKQSELLISKINKSGFLKCLCFVKILGQYPSQ